MHYNEVYQLIKEYETKYPVGDWTYDGITIWPLIILSFNEFISSKKNQKNIQVGHSFSFIGIIKLIKSVQKKGSIKSLFISYDQHRDIVESISYNRHFYKDFNELRKKSLKFESINLSNVSYSNYQENNEIIDFKYINHLAKAVSFFVSVKKEKTTRYEEFLKDIEINLGFIPNGFLKKSIKAKIKLIKSYQLIFHKYLTNKKVKEVRLICHYTIHNFAFTLSAKKLGIPVFEYQHGLIKSHISYSNLIKESLLIPTNFIVWNEESKKHLIKSANIEESKVSIEGDDWKSFLSSLLNKNILLKTTYILYTFSQNMDLNDFQFVKDVRKNTNFEVLIRLHPRNRKDTNLYNSIVDVLNKKEKELFELANSLPIISLLEMCKIHITYWSSSAIEAAFLKIPTIFLSNEGYRIHEKEIPKNLIYKALNLQELISAIKSI